MLRAGTENVVWAGWRKTADVVKWFLMIRDGTGYVKAFSSTSPSLYKWYGVELHWEKGTASGLAELWVDGALICAIGNKNTAAYGDISQVRFGLGELYNSGPTALYGDSFIIYCVVPPAIFEDDFELGSFNMWTGARFSSGETATVTNTLAYNGTYSAVFASNSGGGTEYSYCYKNINEVEVYVRGYFYIASGLPLIDNDDTFYFLRLRAGTQTLARVGIRRSNGVDMWALNIRKGSGWAATTYSTSPAIQMGQWYCIELHWKKDASQGLAEVYVNGVEITQAINTDTSYYGNADSVSAGLNDITNVQKKLIVYCDCFALSNNYIGPEP
jgi:hypothetical protein